MVANAVRTIVSRSTSNCSVFEITVGDAAITASPELRTLVNPGVGRPEEPATRISSGNRCSNR